MRFLWIFLLFALSFAAPVQAKTDASSSEDLDTWLAEFERSLDAPERESEVARPEEITEPGADQELLDREAAAYRTGVDRLERRMAALERDVRSLEERIRTLSRTVDDLRRRLR